MVIQTKCIITTALYIHLFIPNIALTQSLSNAPKLETNGKQINQNESFSDGDESCTMGGIEESNAESPWHVAIFNPNKTFICSGTIITEYLIVSAAHCFDLYFYCNNIQCKLDYCNASECPTNHCHGTKCADIFEVIVAKHSRNYTEQDPHQKTMKIKEIRFSDKGYFGIKNNYAADIALLILRDQIPRSSEVNLARLKWENYDKHEYPLEDKWGKVASWGLTGGRNHIILPYISHQKCVEMLPEGLKHSISFDRFCAGIINGTGFKARPGDSGGGIFFEYNGIYYLRGVLSTSSDALPFATIFTDLVDHLHWILSVRKEIENSTNQIPIQRNDDADTQPRIPQNSEFLMKIHQSLNNLESKLEKLEIQQNNILHSLEKKFKQEVIVSEKDICSKRGEECLEVHNCVNGIALLQNLNYISCSVKNNVFGICCKKINPGSATREPAPTTPAPTTSPPQNPKNSTAIALENCKKYAEYRYVNKSMDNPIPGPNRTIFHREMNCVTENPMIANGRKALPKEYPHMALMGYADSDRFLNVEWKCGGSLISENFVLSAAHCSKFIIHGVPKWALLGVLNTLDVDDAMRAVYSIVGIYDHPNYNPETKHHDITLYQLNTTVNLSPYVRPACLYTPAFKPVRTVGIITGWGAIRSAESRSDDLMKGTIWIVEDSLCSNRFENYNITNNICAGNIQEGTDTCEGDGGGPLQGDGGGPLQVSNKEICMWDIIGVTSYGPGICGGHEDYAVYIYVAVHLDWIQKIVWH